MKALCWHGKQDMRAEVVPDPKIINPHDAIIKITTTAICGSDLHLYNGNIPGMMPGDILGHEFMGEVVEVGSEVRRIRVGDRIVVPFTIACGKCFFCERQLTSLCDNSNPTAAVAERLYGQSGSGLFGYSHIFGGYAGGQAEYVRVPFIDVGGLKIEGGLPDEQVLFLSDIFPTGYMAAENCNIQPGDTVAVFGCGPVGLFAILSAYLLGAERVIAIDRLPDRLRLAETHCNAETINYEQFNVMDELPLRTGGRGPDAVIDAVGMEAHGTSIDAVYDRVKHRIGMATDRPHVLRQAIQTCRKGGTVSLPGVYGGLLDKVNMGAAFSKGLTFKMGQTHVHRYMQPLLELIENGKVDTTFLISHRLRLEDGPDAYKNFNDKTPGFTKVVMKPHGWDGDAYLQTGEHAIASPGTTPVM